MDSKELVKITKDLKEKYPDAGIKSIEIDEKTGKSTFSNIPGSNALGTIAWSIS